MSLTIRSAMPTDEPALRSLAALDSARPLTGETLVAFTGARLAAALEVPSGRTIADPFVETRAIVAALRATARPDARTPSPRRITSTASLTTLLAGRRRRWAP